MVVIELCGERIDETDWQAAQARRASNLMNIQQLAGHDPCRGLTQQTQ